MRRVVIGIILLILVVVVLVNWGRDSADQPQNREQGVAGVTEAVTLAPTVSLPEAAPTELPPTAPASCSASSIGLTTCDPRTSFGSPGPSGTAPREP